MPWVCAWTLATNWALYRLTGLSALYFTMYTHLHYQLAMFGRVLGTEAVSAEVLTTILSRRTICVWVEQDIQSERESVRGTKSLCIIQMATITTCYKVTLYSDWFRADALYTIYRNSLNLDCRRDSVNTGIIHSYSTEGPLGPMFHWQQVSTFLPPWLFANWHHVTPPHPYKIFVKYYVRTLYGNRTPKNRFNGKLRTKDTEYAGETHRA